MVLNLSGEMDTRQVEKAVKCIDLELRREVEVEIEWIRKVKRLAEATMGKCTAGKEG